MVKVPTFIGPFWNVSLWSKNSIYSIAIWNNEYIAEFKKKAKLFDSFSANQCSLINNNSQIPPTLFYKTNGRLSTVTITDDDIFKIIAKLNLNQHRISICMKFHAKNSTFIRKPLRLIFNHCIDNGIYPCKWVKIILCQFRKKRLQTNPKNYRPVSLLSICI